MISKCKDSFFNSKLGKSLVLLEIQERRRIILLAFSQILLVFLDLFGVMLVGLVGALSASRILNQASNPYVNRIIEYLHLQNLDLIRQVSVMSIFALVVLTLRTLITIYLSKRTITFLSISAARLTNRLFLALTKKSTSFVKSYPRQEMLLAITNGPQTIILGVLATTVMLIADASLAIAMLLLLLLVQPITALVTLVFFGLTALLLQKQTSSKIHKYGISETQKNLQVQESILETISVFESLELVQKTDYLAEGILKDRLLGAEATAELQFIPNIGKYMLETMVVLGGFLVAGIQFALTDITGALSSLAIFIVSASRIAPSIMRIQQNVSALKGSLARVIPFMTIIESLLDSSSESITPNQKVSLSSKFDIILDSVNFTYPGAKSLALNNLSIRIPNGQFIAFVGPSGAGKSTLARVILGELIPESGSVQIAGVSPRTLYKTLPGVISYVPQEVTLVRGGFAENVALGFSEKDIDHDLVFRCIEKAGLSSEFESFNGSPEKALVLSGGQKQRIAIARALYTNPKVLVLDEPTSALDIAMEQDVMETILSLKSEVTVIVIAHRLQTIVDADRIVFIENGNVLKEGSFDEVRASIKDFDKQAQIYGL